MVPPSSPTPWLDVVALATLIAGVVYSPDVAAVVGPYIVVIAASVTGAAFSLKRREKTSRLAAFRYFLTVAGVAVFVTGLISWAVGSYYGVSERFLIAPVALAVGAVGNDWGSVLRFFASRALAVIDLFRGGKGGVS